MANLRADNLTGTGGRNALNGSVAFLGDKDALQVPAGSDFAYGTGDFTIEAWIRPEGVTSGEAKGIFCQTQSGNDYVKFFINSDKTVKATFGSDTITGGMVEVGSWSHVAVTRASNTVKVFVNGVASSGTSVTTDFTDTTRKPTIGQYTHSFGTLEYYGYISNFRIVKGTAVYTTDFTPPTEKLTIIPNTVLLCCQDSDNALQEETGKTITGYGRYFAATGEKFANTGFTADSDWTKGSGWTIANGLATHAQGTAGDLYQSVSGLVAGEIYKLSVDIISTDNDVAYFYIDGLSGGSNYPTITSADSSPVGNHFIYFSAPAATVNIGFRGSSLWAGTLTNLRLSSADHGKASKVVPPVGIDEGVTFEGDTKHNTQSYMYFPTGDTSQRGRGRGFRFGGDSPAKANNIEFVNIQSQGTAQDFGDLLTTLTQGHAGSSSIRSIIFAGYNAPATVSDIQYITNATQGNSIDAGINVGGDFSRYCNVVSNEVRSVYGGGTPGYTATIEYVTNASLSSVTDFGDFSAGGMYSAATMNSSTRGIFAGGYYNPGGGATKLNTIQYITIMTTGNSQDFGDLDAGTGGPHGICSSPTRGIAWDGSTNTIQYLTIATTGNGVDFGDATVAGFNSGVSFSSHTRGVAGGGYNNPGSGSANQNWIEYVTISTTGNASDFGDLRTVGSSMGGSSDCHGGLS